MLTLPAVDENRHQDPTKASKDKDNDKDKDKDKGKDKDKDKYKMTTRPNMCHIFENGMTQGCQIC